MGTVGTMLGARSTLPARADVERGVLVLMAQVRKRPAHLRLAYIERAAEEAGEKGIPVEVADTGHVLHRTPALPPLLVCDLYILLTLLLEWECTDPYIEDVRSALCYVNWGARP